MLSLAQQLRDDTGRNDPAEKQGVNGGICRESRRLELQHELICTDAFDALICSRMMCTCKCTAPCRRGRFATTVAYVSMYNFQQMQ